MLMPNGAAATVGLKIGARGGVHTPVSACASGTEALVWAIDLIRARPRRRRRRRRRRGRASTRCRWPAFASMRALSHAARTTPARASRPYDKGRDGFVLGEGAGVLVLESEEHALARGARIYAEVAGAGVTADAYHMAAPDPAGTGAVRGDARRDAGGRRRAVRHRAHQRPRHLDARRRHRRGRRDPARCSATPPPGAAVTATKSMTGHMLGAAGAVEAIATVLAIRDGIAPAIRNLDDPDEEITLDLIRHDNRKIDFTGKAALSNSFGFGGANAAVWVVIVWTRF